MAFTPKLLQQGAGGAGAAEKYIENLFSTYLYTGTGTGYAGSEQNIINGIDVSGKGALIWIKARGLTNAYNSYWNRHQLYDTNRGITFALNSNTSGAHGDTTDSMSTRADGFRLASGGSYYQQNFSGVKYVSWTFRQEPKFFDIVSYTGNGNGAGQVINHNLGSTPGFIICKCTSTTQDWAVCARTGGSASPESGITYATGLSLNTTDAAGYIGALGSFPTSTTFNTAGLFTGGAGAAYPNLSGQTYVAYLFAHNAGGFGLTGNDNVISCGSYTGTSNFVGPVVNLGFEPQWLLIKSVGSVKDWVILDNMRGLTTDGNNEGYILPSTSDIEGESGTLVKINSTGFQASGSSFVAANGIQYIYIAIRKGLMKVPTVGTSVFSPQVQTPSGGANNDMASNSNFPIDWLPTKQKNTVVDWYQTSRLTQNYMSPNTTAAEGTYAYGFDRMSGVGGGSSGWNTNSTVSFAFRRAPGFFDVVAYTGNGGSNTINHNLGVEPELIIFKSRSATENWVVLSDFGPIYFRRAYLDLTNTGPQFGYGDAIINSKPSATSISLLSGTGTNSNAATYVAYLFATCPGVSKVGTYTGNGGSSQDINCGFTSSARFVLIKAVSGTGDWWVWDTARGITSGNDSSLRVNTTAEEVTTLDFINPLASGFTVVGSDSSRNGDGIKYIFLAIA